MPEQRPVTTSTDHDRSERLHVFAHDLRNRLTGLWEVMKALRAGDVAMDPDQLHAFAEKGYFQAQREIEDLLDDFQVDRTVRIPKCTSIPLFDRIEETLKRELHRLDRKGQQVTVTGDRGIEALGDAHWIEQILQALISNASKFSPRGSAIHVKIERSGLLIRVHVTDVGVGMDQGDLADVFVRFAMLASRSTDGEQQCRGTLARARQWSEAMQGELIANSAGVGHGTTFTLSLPAAG